MVGVHCLAVHTYAWYRFTVLQEGFGLINSEKARATWKHVPWLKSFGLALTTCHPVMSDSTHSESKWKHKWGQLLLKTFRTSWVLWVIGHTLLYPITAGLFDLNQLPSKYFKSNSCSQRTSSPSQQWCFCPLSCVMRVEITWETRKEKLNSK